MFGDKEKEKPKEKVKKKWDLDKRLKEGEEYKVVGKNLVKLHVRKKNGSRGQSFVASLKDPVVAAYVKEKGLDKK